MERMLLRKRGIRISAKGELAIKMYGTHNGVLNEILLQNYDFVRISLCRIK